MQSDLLQGLRRLSLAIRGWLPSLKVVWFDFCPCLLWIIKGYSWKALLEVLLMQRDGSADTPNKIFYFRIRKQRLQVHILYCPPCFVVTLVPQHLRNHAKRAEGTL